MARDDLGRSGRLTHPVRRNSVAMIGVGFRRLRYRATRAVDLADASARRADGIVDSDQEAQARVATLRDAPALRGDSYSSRLEFLRLTIDAQRCSRGRLSWR
jgi:hypothetical protein